MKAVSFDHIPSAYNLADILTKPVSAAIFNGIVNHIMHRAPWKDKKHNFLANYDPTIIMTKLSHDETPVMSLADLLAGYLCS